jgi:ribosomal protein S11
MKKMAMLSWKSGGKKAAEKRGGKDDIMNPLRTIQDVFAVEVIMRGFGPGREAFQKALLGSEGHLIRPLVKRVSDATRLKFGGARSPNVRRL